MVPSNPNNVGSFHHTLENGSGHKSDQPKSHDTYDYVDSYKDKVVIHTPAKEMK